MKIAAVLPSRNEANSIANVALAAAVAIGTSDGVVVNVDASHSDDTARNFRHASMPARREYLRIEEPGKGRQAIAGLRLVLDADCVLIIDTDTTNPAPQTYEALIASVMLGADLAIADYPRFWYEGNLTNHIARPLVLATTGLRVCA